MSHPSSPSILALIGAVLVASGTDVGQGAPHPPPPPTLSDEQAAQLDLSDALFALEDRRPQGRPRRDLSER